MTGWKMCAKAELHIKREACKIASSDFSFNGSLSRVFMDLGESVDSGGSVDI